MNNEYFELELELLIEKARYFGISETTISDIVDTFDLEKSQWNIQPAIGMLSDIVRRKVNDSA